MDYLCKSFNREQRSDMKVAQKISKRLNAFPPGDIFTYQQLGIRTNEYLAAAKAMERLVKQGQVLRASTGLFYKPDQTAFGVLKPREEELLKPYLFEGGRRVAYITGVSIYREFGLTTQIANTIKVASRDKKIIARIGNLKITPIKSYVTVTSDNYYLLQLLDAIKDFKIIPDSDQGVMIRRLTALIKALRKNEKAMLLRLALKYPPRVSALLGALLSNLDPDMDLSVLQKRLNPFTTYEYRIDKELLPTGNAWNIK